MTLAGLSSLEGDGKTVLHICLFNNSVYISREWTPFPTSPRPVQVKSRLLDKLSPVRWWAERMDRWLNGVMGFRFRYSDCSLKVGKMTLEDSVDGYWGRGRNVRRYYEHGCTSWFSCSFLNANKIMKISTNICWMDGKPQERVSLLLLPNKASVRQDWRWSHGFGTPLSVSKHISG